MKSLSFAKGITSIFLLGNQAIVHNEDGTDTACKIFLNSGGYQQFSYKGEIVPVHKLVATLYIPNPKGYKVVHHKNGNKTDNRVENLEWTTQSANTNSKGFTKVKISVRDKETNKRMIFESIIEASRALGINKTSLRLNRCAKYEVTRIES